MGIRSRIRTLAQGDQNAYGNTNTPPYGNSPHPGGSPIDQVSGHTPPAQDPAQARPMRLGQPPIGASGRANFYGLPQPDETNAQLIGPQGLRNFDLMYRTDADIRRLVLMCWSPIAAGTWTLEPYGEDDATDQDQMIADTVWWALTKHMSPDFFEHLNTAGPVLLRSGFCPFEQIWAPTEHEGKTLILPRKLDLRLPRSVWRFWQDDYGELTHIGQILPNKPDVVIPTSELVYYRLGGEGDNWVGTSLLRHCYKSWLMKERLERIDAIGNERRAVGVPIVYPPEGASNETRTDMEIVLRSLHTNEVGYLVMPGPHAQDVKESAGVQGWRVEVITFDSSAGSGIQDSLKYHRDGIASAFLGDFMQLGHHQVGARATAQVQEDPFLTAVEALATFIKPPLNRLVERIVELNWPDAAGAPRFNITIHDQASLSELASYVQTLVSAGAMQADPELEDWLRDRADLPPANADVRAQKQQMEQQQKEAELAVTQQQAKPDPPQGKPSEQTRLDAVLDAEQVALQEAIDVAVGERGGGAANPKRLDSGAEPTVKWWENLLSQDRLREALDGARAHIEDSAKPQALLAARQLAHQAVNGVALDATPPGGLLSALASHFADVHRLGHDTVTHELARQRTALHLDAVPGVSPHPGSALERAGRAARTIIERVVAKLEQWLLNHHAGAPQVEIVQQVAEQAALGALHEVALDYTAASINEGRAQAAGASPDAVGAYRTAVLDKNTCAHCASQDTGRLVTVPFALEHPLPDIGCSGGDRCRCVYVYVMADDPAAIAAGLG